MTLIDRLEASTEGSRELDAEVFKAIGAPAPFQFMNKLIALEFNDVEQAYFARVTDDMQVRYSPPHYTTSIDAAMTLVPEGGFAEINTYDNPDCFVWPGAGEECFQGTAATPALALAIAALKATNDH